MKPSSDIALTTTTLPVLVLVSLILFLRRTWDVPLIRSGAFQAAPLPSSNARPILPEKDHLALKSAARWTRVAGPAEGRRQSGRRKDKIPAKIIISANRNARPDPEDLAPGH